MRVVIADDETIIRMDLRMMLEDLNYEVVCEAADGFDAVEACRRLQPDIVLMDLEMPLFGGKEAAETILSENIAGCIVIVTAYADEGFLRWAGDVGVSGYLVKPIEARLLRPTLEIATAQSRRLREMIRRVDSAEMRLQESRLVARAQQQLAQEKGIAPAEAYRQIQKTAMEKGCSMGRVAEAVLGRQKITVDEAKKLLMEKKNLSEAAAFRRIRARAKEENLSDEAAARLILREENRHA